MDTRRLTALALILGPALGMIGWIVFGFFVMDGTGPDKAGEFIAGLGENSTVVKYLMSVVTLLFLLGIGALGMVKNSMEGGSGHYTASFGFFLLIIGSAGQLGETAFTIATAEAAHVDNMVVASAMFAGSSSIGAVATAITMLGFALIGLGILQQKNFNPIIAGLMIVTGIFTLVFSVVDYENPLIGIGFLGVVVSFVCLGVSLLTKKE